MLFIETQWTNVNIHSTTIIMNDNNFNNRHQQYHHQHNERNPTTADEHQQSQLGHQKHTNNSNLQAQQAAAEAISISRSALHTTISQGEQLHHCNDLRVRNEYIVKKSERLIRGMTWSGRVKNLFTPDIAPPSKSSKLSFQQNMKCSMEKSNNIHSDGRARFNNDTFDDAVDVQQYTLRDVPLEILPQASLFTNYKSNVLLLSKCENENDYQTCLDICNTLQTESEHSLIGFYHKQQEQAFNHHNGHNGHGELTHLKNWIDKIQLEFHQVQELHSSLVFTPEEINDTFRKRGEKNISTAKEATEMKRNDHDSVKQALFLRKDNPKKSREQRGGIVSSLINNHNSTTSELKSQYKEQEDHLNILSNHLQELQQNSTSMGMILNEQSSVLDTLNDGTDDLVESTKMISRKAERIRYRTMWKIPRSDYKCSVILQHVPSENYLIIQPQHNNKLALSPDAHSDASIFDVYERRTPNKIPFNDANDSDTVKMIGFCNRSTKKWLGQSKIFGAVTCSTWTFGKNEEWELDDGMMDRTRILCASANWGSGGWLNIKYDEQHDCNFSFGGYDASSKKSASLWNVIVINEAT